MPPFDREGALKSAEKALRQGRIDAAIAEYAKIVESQPRDWNSANALGDLFVRAGQTDKGLAQYTRIADHLAEEGFYSKAAALFKKILKLKTDDEYALLQSGDLAAKQGTLADAKQYFLTAAELRRKRGDKKGAAEINIRIGTLDPEDVDSRLGAARAAVEMGDTVTGLREFRDVATLLDKRDRPAEALGAWQSAFELDQSDDSIRTRLFAAYLANGEFDKAQGVARGVNELKQIAGVLEQAGRGDDVLAILGRVVELDPNDLGVRAGLALAYVGRGDLEKAQSFLSPETAGTNPALWLTLGEIELRGGRVESGRAAIAKAITLDRNQAQAAVVLGCRLAEADSDTGYQCIEAVADAALAESDFAAAAVALHEFTTRVRLHLVALMRLVEICVDGGLEATMYEAQMQLADAYLEVGRGLEARIISEDLVAREPWNRVNIDRFRRALVMLGEHDPDGIIAERLSGESPFLATDKLDLNDGVSFDTPPPPAPPPAPAAGAKGKGKKKGSVEAESNEDPGVGGAEAASSTTPAPQRSLDQVFRGLRDEAGRQSAEESAAEQYALALTYLDMGMQDDAIKALEVAARSPRQRFEAASTLGRLFLARQDAMHAIEWLERAAEAPAPTPEAGRALLYDLGQTLEALGEDARALAVFVELESESAGYRDVSGRIDRLSKAQARG